MQLSPDWTNANWVLNDQFLETKRALTEADTPEEWHKAFVHLLDWVERVGTLLEHDVRQAQWSLDNLADVFAMLLTLAAEFPQYRHETFVAKNSAQETRLEFIRSVVFPKSAELRGAVIRTAKALLHQGVFVQIWPYLQDEIYPLLDQLTAEVAPDRYMPFRVVLVGDLYERMLGLEVRTVDPVLSGPTGLLRLVYDRKYLRFGTSGVRGRWNFDFTEQRAKQVVQAICDFLKLKDVPSFVGSEDLAGKTVVIGYDSRLHARRVAEWVASVVLANGFKAQLAYRDSPTPALVYWLTEELPRRNVEVAALINCTASHNPPEWHGIKFNPRLGYPAPTNVTDFIAARANEIQFAGVDVPSMDLDLAEREGLLEGFDPIDGYVAYVFDSGRGELDNGKGATRIPIDFERIRRQFHDDLVIIDEMHGAGRGYLARILGQIGVRFMLMHDQTDPHIPTLPYANPEEPYIDQLKQRVAETRATLGIATDTDADRFGIVDQGGRYLRPNQILPLLVRYLAVDRQLHGRIGATVTGSPLIELLASKAPGNAGNEPDPAVVPAYVKHPFYQLKVGQMNMRQGSHAFFVMVGVKYLEEIRRMDRCYDMLAVLPENWRDLILVAGEESSGAIFRGHVTDKDGIFADLVVMDMLAYYRERGLRSMWDLWQDTCRLDGLWESYGGGTLTDPQSNSGRTDIDAVLEAKELLISHYLDTLSDRQSGALPRLGRFEVVFAGGVRYDLVELQLRDETGDDRHYLRIRSSGTEPLNRVYVESPSKDAARELRQMVVDKLDELASEQVRRAGSEWRLASVLVYSRPSNRLRAALNEVMLSKGWSRDDLLSKLQVMWHEVENRNKETIERWQAVLREE